MSAEQGAAPTALITGASGGIGLELAGVFAEHGFDLIVVARREERLLELGDRLEREHQRRVTVLAADLLAEGAARRLHETIAGAGLEVDVLVNNAGVMELGAFREIDLDTHLRLIQLNVASLTALTHLWLAPMLARGSGRILNVASIAAFQPVPSLAVYAATKAFVLSLTESLSEELRGSGVTVTALCPGFTRTEMYERAQASNDAVGLPGFLLSDAREVARDGYAACMKGEVIAVPGVLNRVHTRTVGVYPRWLVRGVGGLFGRRLL
jgi:uncharacterized protein